MSLWVCLAKISSRSNNHRISRSSVGRVADGDELSSPRQPGGSFYPLLKMSAFSGCTGPQKLREARFCTCVTFWHCFSLGTVLTAMRFRSGGILANEKLGCFNCRRAVERNEQIDRRWPKA